MSVIVEQLKRIDEEERPHILTEFIRKTLAEFLEIDDSNEITINQDFIELGVTSLEAVNYKIELEKKLNCALKTTLFFDYPKLNLLVDYLLTEVLDLKENTTKKTTPKTEHKFIEKDDIAIVAIDGIFPHAETPETLWNKSIETTTKKGTANSIQCNHLGDLKQGNNYLQLGITQEEHNTSSKQEQLAYHTIARALKNYDITLQQLSNSKTAVFFASDLTDKENSTNKLYQVPLANAISFTLNLNGPSEMVNTFCSSIYVATHRAIQSIHERECDQALVGGVNLISKKNFDKAVKTGVYDDLLSDTNSTQSFSNDANGFVRSEGAGAILLKPLSKALKDNNTILAVIKGSAIAHGGRNFSLEAPKAEAIKKTSIACIKKANIAVDTINYIEAHGIANTLADAIELTALNHSYSGFNKKENTKWHISTVKPTIGHPELVSGIASLIKVIKAFEHNIIPGIPNLQTVNTEIPNNHHLILQNKPTTWHTKDHPKRAALNSYAIGGVNAHLILEKHTSNNVTNRINKTKNKQEHLLKKPITLPHETAIKDSLKTIFNLKLEEINRELSPLDYGFDSIKIVAFIKTINETLSIDIKLGEALGFTNFNDLFTAIANKKPVDTNLQIPIKNTTTKTLEHPISIFQKGLWLSYKLNPEETTYNLPIIFSVTKDIKPHYALHSLAFLLEKHPVLRTYFHDNTNAVIQKIHPISYCLNFDDAELKTTPEEEFKKLLQTPFNLENDCLLRLYKRTDSKTKQQFIIFIIHHTILDGLSGALFMKYFWEAYTAIEKGNTPIIEETDYHFFNSIIEEQHYLNSPKASSDLEWWLYKLKDLQTLHLPLDHSPKNLNTIQNKGKQTLHINGASLQLLKNTAKELNVSIAILLMAYFKIVLSKLTLQNDITIATPTEGRQKTAYTNSLGCFVNVLLIRTVVDNKCTLKQVIEAVKTNFLDGLDHANYPLTNILEALYSSKKGQYTTNNKIPVSFTYQNIFDSILGDSALNNIATPLYDIYQETQDEYAMEVYDFRDTLQIHIKYKTELFENETIRKHLDYFKTIIKQTHDNSNLLLSEFSITSQKDKQLFIKQFDNTSINYPKNKTVIDLFEEQVVNFPKHTAVTYNDQAITYSALNQKVNKLVSYLKNKGLTNGNMVVLCLERSLDTIISILAVAKAGATYVPVDVNYPIERISYTIEDTQCKFIICNTNLSTTLNSKYSETCTIINTVKNQIDINQEKDSNLQIPIQPEDNLYVIYTSGTTGKPKGVIITHNNVVRLLKNEAPLFNFNENDVWSFFHSYCFDFSVWELFGALLFGGRLVIIPNHVKKDALAFGKLLEKEQVTILNQTPSAFYNLQEQIHHLSKQLAIRYVIFGGEALQPALLKTWHATYKNCKLINMYGITETTVHVTYQEITEKEINDGKSTIGIPIPTLSCYVLDENLKLLPQGVAGELYVGGEGVAKGYLNRAKLTEIRFINNPFKPNSRLYKTGDIVKWNYNNQLEYIGRTDEQVKIRGYRIELSEIEHVLLQHPNISQCVVLARELNKNNKQLIAYSIFNTEIEKEHITAFLKQKLPEYMIPSAFITLEEFPITLNGKINIKALPLPTSGALQKNYTAPKNQTEKAIATVFQTILEVEQIGVYDNFFEMGGHSLLVIKAINSINKSLNKKLTPQHLFKFPTVSDLALSIKNSTYQDKRIYLEKEIVLNSNEHYSKEKFIFESNPKHIFVTGCTGFVGVYLLKELLDTTNATIHCLTRASNQEQAYQKIKKALSIYNLWDDDYQTRINALFGNLGSPLLGLSKPEFNTLSTSVDVIYHNAAHMNHIATYDMLKADNVDGALEIIKLACLNKTKAIHYTSTLAIFNNTERNSNTIITEKSRSTNEIHYDKDGYATSKWVGENIMLEAQKHGIPCSIYRLGLTTGHSTTGQSDKKQWFYGFMKCCITMEAIVNTDLDLELPMLPVDTVAKSLVYLSQQKHALNNVFHISGKPISIHSICKAYNETLDSAYAELSLHDWLQKSKTYDNLPIPPFMHHYLELDAKSLAFEIQKELKAHIKIMSHYTEKQLNLSTLNFNKLSKKSSVAYFNYVIEKEKLTAQLV